MKFYTLENNYQFPENHYFGASILWAGYVPLDFDSNNFYVERVGPFVPPIYHPSPSNSCLIFTLPAKEKIENSELNGIFFNSDPLEKRKIVNIDWKSWDPTKEYYDILDFIEEPEDFIELCEHDEKLAQSIPSLWMAIIKSKVSIRFEKTRANNISILELASWDLTSDFMLSDDYLSIFISQKAKDWFEEYYPGIFIFTEVQTC